MDGPSEPTGGWWSTRDERRAERRQRRAERHATRDAARVAGREDRAALTVERIAEAALAIVDAEGLDGLSLRRLAAALGVGATTIYWYVRDKEELLDLLRDRMAGEIRAGTPFGVAWRGRAEAFARGLRATILRHSNAAPIWGWRPALGPNALETIETLLAAFLDAGLTDERAVDACVVLLNFVTGSAAWESAQRRTVGTDEARRRSRDYVAGLPPDRLPNLRRVGERFFVGGDADARFELGLASLLDGLVQRPAV
jgi:AcrR family transcriptional regulator